MGGWERVRLHEQLRAAVRAAQGAAEEARERLERLAAQSDAAALKLRLERMAAWFHLYQNARKVLSPPPAC